jgi:hypothetical protein
MLKELRRALADTIAEGAPNLRVLPEPPKSADVPTNGDLFAYVQPADPYVEAWLSFSNGGRGTVNLEVVILVPEDNAERAWERLDDAIDPLSDASNVFSSVLGAPTLGVPTTDFDVNAVPLLDPVQSPRVVEFAEGAARFYELTLPVRVTVERR